MQFTDFFGQEVKTPISHLSVTLSSLKLGEFLYVIWLDLADSHT